MSYTPVGGGAGLILVSAQEVAGAAVDRFIFPGLNGDLDGVYELWWFLENRQAGCDSIEIQPNNLNTNQTTTWTVTVGTPATPNSLNEAAFPKCSGTGLQRPRAWGKIAYTPRTGSFRSFISESGEGDLVAGGNYDRWYHQGLWRDSVTNITSLVLKSVDVGNSAIVGFGIGSRAQLWKRPF